MAVPDVDADVFRSCLVQKWIAAVVVLPCNPWVQAVTMPQPQQGNLDTTCACICASKGVKGKVSMPAVTLLM